MGTPHDHTQFDNQNTRSVIKLTGDLLKSSLWARAVLEEKGKFIVELPKALFLELTVVLDANFNQIGAISKEDGFTVIYHPAYSGSYLRRAPSLKLYPKYLFH